MGLSTRPTVIEQELNTLSTVQQGALGTRVPTLDGREFVYGLAGASTLAIGKLTQSPAAIGTTHGTVASPLAVQAAAAVGATQVSLTLGATASAANQYAGGYVVITDSAGAGQSLLIRNHAAVLSAGVITLNLIDPVTTALTTSSKAVLTLNPYAGLLISATTTVDKYTGVPNVAVTAANYGWFQQKGVAAVLADASTWTSTVSFGVTGSGATAGAVMIAATSNQQEVVGYTVNSIPVSAKYSDINLNIV